jgi:uncharacterized protein (UPF0332 family)
MTDLEREEIVA